MCTTVQSFSPLSLSVSDFFFYVVLLACIEIKTIHRNLALIKLLYDQDFVKKSLTFLPPQYRKPYKLSSPFFRPGSENCFKFAHLCQICAFIFAISWKRVPPCCVISRNPSLKKLAHLCKTVYFINIPCKNISAMYSFNIKSMHQINVYIIL